MAQEHVFDLIPGYALGCLDEQDLLLVAWHLPHCPLCRNELAAYWETIDHIALAIPQQSPATGLKERILERVSAKPLSQPGQQAEPIQAASPRQTLSPAKTNWMKWLLGRPAAVAVAAAVLLLLAFLAISNVFLWQQVNSLQASMPSGPARFVRLDGTPDAPNALAYLVVFPTEPYGTLVVEAVPPLPPGYEYQLWLIRDGKRTSGGLFTVSKGGYGTLEVWTEEPLDSYPSFGVTVEPAGGSPGPTGAKVLGGDL